MKEKLPQETQAIFETLIKGLFISGDSQKAEMKTYFKAIDNNNNYQKLKDYFSIIGFQLIKGNDYYYFSKQSTNNQIEEKINKTYKWIDILDFLITYGNSIDDSVSVGYIFTAQDIFKQCQSNNILLKKIDDIVFLKKYTKISEKIENLIKELLKESFAESYNELNEQYKILAAFEYLIQLIDSINIKENEEPATSQ